MGGQPRTLSSAVALLAATVVGLGAVEIALMYSGVPAAPPWQVLLFPIASFAFLAAGVGAWLRRPSNRTGTLLTAGALAMLASGLTSVTHPALVGIGVVMATVPFAVVVHLLHAFPSGRLRGRLSAATVAAGYGVCILLQAPLYLWAPGPLQIANRPGLADAGHWVQHGAGLLVMILTALVLAHRLGDSTGSERRSLVPLYGYGVVVVLWLPLCTDLHWLAGWSPLVIEEVQLVALAVVPIAYLLAMVLGGFTRTGEIEELAAWLEGDGGGRPSLEHALAKTLGDSSLSLVFWLADAGAYFDAEGRPVTLPPVGSRRAAVEISVRGERVGAIAYDATLISDPGLVRAAGRMAALALERERLTTALRSSQDRLRASRGRIAGAADEERRRIARDLHDGLQTRLIVLGIKAHAIRRHTLGAHGEADELYAGLQTAITELRELVHGVMPAALTERGLYAAVEELAESLPIPTRLLLDETPARLPAAAESAAYFLVSEAMTNAIKHSHARELEVRIVREQDRLLVEVSDDGVGGLRRGSGAGLRAIADRIEALDGHLRFDSPPGGGTRLLAEMPCES